MTIPFLVSFVPFISPNQQICQSIDDMISINLMQTVAASNITYNIGTSEDVNIPLEIKNLTSNSSLEVGVDSDNKQFLIDGLVSSGQTFLLNPGQTKTYVITLNTSQLDTTVGSFLEKLRLTVKNISNGEVITKPLGVAGVSTRLLEETIITID